MDCLSAKPWFLGNMLLGDYLVVKVHACVGGTSVRDDQRILASGVHVVVGTPGRVFDMLRRQSLRPDNIKMFVLDEADEMLSRGFKDQVYFSLLVMLQLPVLLSNHTCVFVCSCHAATLGTVTVQLVCVFKFVMCYYVLGVTNEGLNLMHPDLFQISIDKNKNLD